MPTTDVIGYVPISVPRGWALPIVLGCSALVVLLVGGSMLANRGVARKWIALFAVAAIATACAVLLIATR